MPTILRSGPYRVHIFLGDRAEPRHVHVARDGADAKFWLDPEVSLARNRGFILRELRTIQDIVQQNIQQFRDAWDDLFNP